MSDKEAERILTMTRDMAYDGYSFVSEAEQMALKVQQLTDELEETTKQSIAWQDEHEKLTDELEELKIKWAQQVAETEELRETLLSASNVIEGLVSYAFDELDDGQYQYATHKINLYRKIAKQGDSDE